MNKEIRILAIIAFVIMIVIYVYTTVRKYYLDYNLYKKENISGAISKSKEDMKSDLKKKRNAMVKELLNLFIPLIIAYITLNYIIGISVIQSASMEPTLMTGNMVFVNRLSYIMGQDIRRGDIVIFNSDELNASLGKRVIGIPGDHIEFKDGYVVINGLCYDESSYINENIETICEKEFDVPDECYFLLGDNREKSLDSRFWISPYINKDKIVGKYMGQIALFSKR